MNRKEQRKIDAEKRRLRKDVLQPLQSDLRKAEATIAELEATQANLTAHMEDPAVVGDSEKMQKASHSYSNNAEKLEKAFTRWEEINEKIEKLEAELA